jgi:hypothetical protein
MKDTCNKCGAEIFSTFSENMDGLCKVCKQAILQKIEIAEHNYQEQKRSHHSKNCGDTLCIAYM